MQAFGLALDWAVMGFPSDGMKGVISALDFADKARSSKERRLEHHRRQHRTKPDGKWF
jgi:hypothetical protein